MQEAHHESGKERQKSDVLWEGLSSPLLTEDEEAGVWPKEQAYPLDAGKDEETNPTQIPQTGSSPGQHFDLAQ